MLHIRSLLTFPALKSMAGWNTAVLKKLWLGNSESSREQILLNNEGREASWIFIWLWMFAMWAGPVSRGMGEWMILGAIERRESSQREGLRISNKKYAMYISLLIPRHFFWVPFLCWYFLGVTYRNTHKIESFLWVKQTWSQIIKCNVREGNKKLCTWIFSEVESYLSKLLWVTFLVLHGSSEEETPLLW